MMDELDELSKEQLITEVGRVKKFYKLLVRALLRRNAELQEQIKQDDG